MPFDINRFSGELRTNGVSKNHTYECVLTRNPSPDTQIERRIAMRADTVSLPGKTINTTDIHYSGPLMKIATDANYEPLRMSIILSEDQAEREYLEEWFDLISGNLRTAGKNNPSAYAIGYHDEYVGSLRINHYDETGNQIYAYEFIDIWPVSIGEIELSYEGGGINKLSVSFSYHYYKTEKL